MYNILKKMVMVMIISLSCLSCSSHELNNKSNEYHLVYLKDVPYDKLGNRAPSNSTNIHYIGKFVIKNNNDFHFDKIESAPDFAVRSAEKRFDNWRSGATSLYNSTDKKYYKYGDIKFIETVKQNLNSGTIAIIDPKVGVKYFEQNISADKNKELLDSIEKLPVIKPLAK